MDLFQYVQTDPNDEHECCMLRELNDLSLVQLTQKRWFDREMNTVAKQITYLGGRKNQEKHAKKRSNVLKAMDISNVHDTAVDDDLLDDDLDDMDVEEMMKDDPNILNDVEDSLQAEKKAKTVADILKGGRRKAVEKEIVPEGDGGQAAGTIGAVVLLTEEERQLMTEDEIEAEEARLLKEANESFLKAVIAGDINGADALLHTGAEINYIGRNGLSALHYASAQEKTNMLEWLISKEDLELNLVKRGERYNAYQHCLTSVIHGTGATQQSLDLLHLAGATLPPCSTAKKLENEFHEEWNQKMQALEAQKRLDLARGNRRGKGTGKKPNKKAKKKKKPKNSKK